MLKHDAALLCALVVIQFVLSFVSPQSTWDVLWNNCEVEVWRSEYNPHLWRKALPWCETEDRDRRDTIASLMLSMKRNSPTDQDRVVAATSFGTNVQVYYMPEHDEFLINPQIIETGGKTKWYQCGSRNPPMYTWIKVRYIDGTFRHTTKAFTMLDASAIQCEISRQNL